MILLEILEKHYDVELMGENNVTFPCPWCGKEDKHFNVSLDSGKQVFHCYKCGISGTWVTLVAKIEKVSFLEAIELLKNDLDLYIPPEKIQTNNYIMQIPLPPRANWTANSWEYLEKRRISLKTKDKFGLYYCNSGKYANRIIIPIYFEKQQVTFQARALFDTQIPRYKSPSNSPVSQIWFNWDSWRGEEKAIVVEGVFDAMRMDEFGEWAISPLGKNISDIQMDLLEKRKIRKLILMQDADTLLEIEEKWNKLSKRFDVEAIPLLQGDPADLISLDGVMENKVDNINDLYAFRLRNFKLDKSENLA